MAALALLAAATPVLAVAQGPQLPPDPRAATSFDQILAAPDDGKLNLKYAREQANAGNLLGAAAALERLLLQQPDWHAARLFYAAVLYRLDDLAAARREIGLLKGRDLPPTLRAEVDKYSALVDRRTSRSRIGGQVSVGVAYDSDAAGAVANAINLGAGVPISDDGLSATASASATAARKVGDGDGVELFATVSAVAKYDIAGPEQRFLAADGQIGVSISNGTSTARAGPVIRHISVDGSTYLTEVGGRVEATTRLSPRLSLNGAVTVVHQDFDEISNLPLIVGNDQRTGTDFDAVAGIGYRLTGRQSIAFEFGYEDKGAQYRPFAFHGPILGARYAALLGRGAYFTLAGSIRWLDYKAPDLLISGITRKDTRYFARAALGAPLSAFSVNGSTHDIREAIRLEGALNYVRRDSEAPYLDYDSFGAELRMIYKFGG